MSTRRGDLTVLDAVTDPKVFGPYFGGGTWDVWKVFLAALFSRRFVGLSAERLAAWMASDLSKLDLLVIQIDGLRLVLVVARVRAGKKHGEAVCCCNGIKQLFLSIRGHDKVCER
jgi:hypothetical protein